MINKEKLIHILESNLDVGPFTLLDLLNKGILLNDLWTIQKVRSWREALIRRSLLHEVNGEYILTDNAKSILNTINNIEEEEIVPETPFVDFCTSLHAKIEARIVELTGRKRYVNPSGKALNSPQKELCDRFISFFKEYGPVSYILIEKAILQYVEDAIQQKVKYPVRLIYFIFKTDKEGKKISEMVEWIENIEENELKPNYDGGVNI